MNTPMPTDHEIEAELRAVLLAESERITPDPALHRILERAHAGDRPRAAMRRRRWLSAVAGAVATAGIAAAAIVIFAPGDDGSRPTSNEPPASEGMTLRTGEQVDLAVWLQNPDETLVSGDYTITSTGDVGVDAVQLLLQERPRGMVNPWAGAAPKPKPVARVNDVTHDGGTVTVDFDRMLDPLPSLASPEFGRPVVQQLVLTVQSALRTDDPVLLTINGEPADEAFGYPLSGSVEADWSLVSGIRPTAPTQGATVTSPVTITGESSTNEGNVLWQITSDDRVVKKGLTTGGSTNYAAFAFDLRLDPGEYTVKLWEPNVASGSEAWTDEMSVVYIDFTVE